MNKITKFQLWLLRHIAANLVRQGPHHESNIEAYYDVINRAAHEQFTEDNKPTLDHFLAEAFRRSINTYWT